jgi:tight adherence protein C
MLWIISVSAFACTFILIHLLFQTCISNDETAELRLRSLLSAMEGRIKFHAGAGHGTVQRKFARLFTGWAPGLTQFVPTSIRQKGAEKLAMAGGIGGIGPNGYILLTLAMGLYLPIIIAGILLVYQLPGSTVLRLSMGVAALGFILPFLFLNYKIRTRQHSMQRDLPDAVDLVTASVEAGLSFDGALQILSEKMEGALVDEFTRMLNEMRVGVPRREALVAMGKRCNIPDVSGVVTSLIQADQLGVSIGNVLRIKSVAIREKQRQRAQELGMKAPVKMLIPLVFFIFPVILVIMLGPAAIKISEMFLKR